MMKRPLTIILLLALAGIMQAQVSLPTAWRNYIEQLSEDGEDETVEDLLEIYADYHEHPANINDTICILCAFPFINDFQRSSLRAYIILYGPLLSLAELEMINGFDSVSVALLSPLVEARMMDDTTKLSLKEILTHGHSNLILGASGTIEQAKGYTNDIYEGNNMRMMWRYLFKYKDKVQLLVSGDKDPGEALFHGSQTQGFDFYGFSIMVNDIGKGRIRLKRAIIGQYHAQFGQGLALWSGFGSRTITGTSAARYASGLRPNGVFSEYGYLQGAATTLSLSRHTDLTLLYSNVDKDATLPSDDNADWVQSLYNSGYHRTANEIGKKDQLNEQVIASHLEFHGNLWKVGLTGSATLLDKAIIPAQYAYNDNAFSGTRNYNAGCDFAYRYRQLYLFGEVAACANHAFSSQQWNISPAALLGAEWTFNNNHRLSFLSRYYSPYYHNLHASAIGKSSTPQNELGAGLNYQGVLPWRVTLAASADFFYFPHARYQVYEPSAGQEYRVTLSKAISKIKGLSLNLRYRYKDQAENISSATLINGSYLVEQTYRHQIITEGEYARGGWKFTTRIGYTYYYGEESSPQKGLLFYQDVQYHPINVPLTIATRLALFDVDDYDARLYAVESDFIYQYNGALYQNEGLRYYLLARYDFNEHWNLGFKYGITLYTDQDTFGSGYEQIQGNHRQQWRIQLRLKW